VGSASHFRFIQQVHALAAEAQGPTGGQHPISGSYNKITHNLWKDKGRRGSASYFRFIQQVHALPVKEQKPTWGQHLFQVHTTRSRTSCRRTKADVGSASYVEFIQQDHAHPVGGKRPMWGQYPISGSYNKFTHSLWKDKGRCGVSILFRVHTTSSRTRCGRTKTDMGSACYFRFIQQVHALAMEGQRPTWVSMLFQVHTTSPRTRCGRTKANVGSACYFRFIQQDHALAVEGQRPTRCQHPISGSYNKITHSLWKDKGRHWVSILFQVHTTKSRTPCGMTKANVVSATHLRFIQQDHALPVEGQRPTWCQQPISGSCNKITHFL
jgi:hypothetical protein